MTFDGSQADRLAREAVQQRWDGVSRPARHTDFVLVGAALVLAGFGLMMIHSATSYRLEVAGQNELQYVIRQAIALAIGMVGMVAVSLFDYRVYRAWAPLLYGATLLMLVYVLFGGSVINGSQAWIQLAGFQFQPSELAKVSLILMLAALFHERREEALGLRALVEALGVAAAPMVLVLLQPDFGTFMVYVAIVCGVLLLARVRVRYMVALTAIGLAAIIAVLLSGALAEYQVKRLTAFVNPGEASPESIYNVKQAQIAVGSGQFTGRGLGNGSQTALSFVPENQTDFIFTVVGEELGFVGSSVMLAIFALILLRGLRIAAASQDTFGTLIAGGVVSVLAFQLFINVGMTIGLMPVTGLTLPFVSYGGTSLISSFLMIGLLQNVHIRRFS
ncbi:MAG: rod shape-determining protein RodA [Egibacteraceae bacterium]